MGNLWELCIWQAIMADMVFVEKIVPLWPIGYEERASFVLYLKVLKF